MAKKIKCYACKNQDLVEENNGECPYCKGKGYICAEAPSTCEGCGCDVTEDHSLVDGLCDECFEKNEAKCDLKRKYGDD